MSTFIPGLELCRRFHHEVVAPILASTIPNVPYSAGLLGPGSEVLGFDTPMSTDHDWGPRVMIFLRAEESDAHRPRLADALHDALPDEFQGFPVFLAESKQLPTDEPNAGGLYHRVEVWTIRNFLRFYLGFDVGEDATASFAPVDWLTFPSQKLRSITAGAVYHDEIGLQALRDCFAWYPHDVWLYLLAAGWTRIGQEEHLMGRAGYVSDEIGSALIANRLVRDLMTLSFLLEKQYAPYPKWFGTAFGKLNCASTLSPILRAVQAAATWQEREQHLSAAYAYVTEMHNTLNITVPMRTKTDTFFTRPFRVIWGGGFADAIVEQITDPQVAQIAQQRLIGSIDQFSDSTDLLEDVQRRSVLRRLYQTCTEP